MSLPKYWMLIGKVSNKNCEPAPWRWRCLEVVTKSVAEYSFNSSTAQFKKRLDDACNAVTSAHPEPSIGKVLASFQTSIHSRRN
jgi:hypothetical protein